MIKKIDDYFIIKTKSTMLVLKINKANKISCLHYGASIEYEDFKYLDFEIPFYRAYPIETEKSFNFLTQLNEFSEYGKGDYDCNSVCIESEDGGYNTDFIYNDYQIVSYFDCDINLPSSKNKSQTLIISLKDQSLNLELKLYYSTFKKSDVICKQTSVKNFASTNVSIKYLSSLNQDFYQKYELIYYLSGASNRENHLTKEKIKQGIFSLKSNLGASGHFVNPAVIIGEKNLSEHRGQCIGFNYIYSGDFEVNISKNPFSRIRVNIGINRDVFSWSLEPSEIFFTPEAIMVFSNEGCDKISQEMHSFINENIIPNASKKREVVINTWESAYFDFDEKKLLDIAKRGKEIGADILVIDDGWFGNRYDDTSSLGDWVVNENKFPNGFSKFCKKIKELGLKLGLWFEPEMVSLDSKFYEKNKNSFIKSPIHSSSFGRNQKVLNFTDESIVKDIKLKMASIIKKYNIEYIKIDMNRNITEPYLTGNLNGEFMHRYILGVYSMLSYLRKQFKNLIIETCAGGGGRFDLGMACLSEYMWLSDNTDPYSRYWIQNCSSIFYPISLFSNHISSINNHQTGRKSSFKTKFEVALFGQLGYEVDLKNADVSTIKELNKLTFNYKTYQNEILHGVFHRGENTKRLGFWYVEAKNYVFIGIFNFENVVNPGFRKLKLEKIKFSGILKCIKTGKDFNASLFKDTGVFLNYNECTISNINSEYRKGDANSNIIILKKQKKG